MRGRLRSIAPTLAILALLQVPTARAEPDAGAPAASSPAPECKVRDKASIAKARSILEQIVKVAAGPMERKESLDTIKAVPSQLREGLALVRCAEASLSDGELRDFQAFEARLAKAADELEARVAAETKAREDIVLPLCQATWGVEQARAAIARERSNPGGVADLRVLHDAGEDVQRWQAEIAQQKPRYNAFRKHPFTQWQNEGVCVAETKKP